MTNLNQNIQDYNNLEEMAIKHIKKEKELLEEADYINKVWLANNNPNATRI